MNTLKLKQEKTLKLYFPLISIDNKKFVELILGYSIDDVVNYIKTKFQKPFKIEILNQTEASKVLNLIEQQPLEVNKQTREDLKMNKVQFINNLRLVSDKFVKDKKNREFLRELLEKVENNLEKSAEHANIG